jgi:hypothetical protein
MKAGLADEFAAKPPGRGTPGQLASARLLLVTQSAQPEKFRKPDKLPEW